MVVGAFVLAGSGGRSCVILCYDLLFLVAATSVGVGILFQKKESDEWLGIKKCDACSDEVEQRSVIIGK